MNWGQFISKLDGVRTLVRANKDPKATIRKDDPIIDQLIQMLDEVMGTTPKPEPEIDALAACIPEEPEAVSKEPIAIVERGQGEGRMLIMPRETPRIQRAPQLEEVFDEKELGK